MEVRYAPGSGTLLGAGERWLLLDVALHGGPDGGPDAELADRLWDLVTAATPGSLDTVVATLVEAYGEDVSFALVDLSPVHGSVVTRGHARVAEADGAHRLSLGDEHRPGPLRLTGGIVAAGSADLRPAAHPRPPRPPRPPVTTAGISAAPPPPPVDGLIDGIPAEILASRAGDPPPAPTPVVTADPVDDSRRRLEERIGHTVRRAPDPDHDGRTTFRPTDVAADATVSAPAPDHLHQATQETVLAVRCAAGHLTAAFVPTCRVCSAPVPPQEPARVPRPQLGVVRLPDGDTVPLDRGVVLGRQPTSPPETVDWPHLVRVPQDLSYVSRIHLRIELDGWLVLATDLGSRSGTTLRVPGRPPERIRAHQPYVWEPGQVLDLADSFEIEYRTQVAP